MTNEHFSLSLFTAAAIAILSAAWMFTVDGGAFLAACELGLGIVALYAAILVRRAGT